jgi:hypothetical protein
VLRFENIDAAIAALDNIKHEVTEISHEFIVGSMRCSIKYGTSWDYEINIEDIDTNDDLVSIRRAMYPADYAEKDFDERRRFVLRLALVIMSHYFRNGQPPQSRDAVMAG